MIYESEIEEILLEHSKKQYGIEETESLIAYLLRRSLIGSLTKGNLPKMKEESFLSHWIEFWMKDLAMPMENGAFTYKGAEVKSKGYANPLQNIAEDLLYQLSSYRLRSGQFESEFTLVMNDVQEWVKEAKKQTMKYRKKPVYSYLVKRNALAILNKTYQATVQHPFVIPDIHYPEVPFQLSEEEHCDRQISAYLHKHHDGELVSEAELENYVARHLSDIEEGLKIIQSQYLLPNGRIDILARDQEGKIVIIELKTEKDTDVLWQKWYYTAEVTKAFRDKSVRFMVILPQLYPEIITSLQEGSSPAEILQFYPIIQNGKIISATFEHHTGAQTTKDNEKAS